MGDDIGVLHITGDDVEDIVRRVFLGVIAADVVGLDAVEDVEIADDGIAIRTLGVSNLEQAAAGAAAGIVLAHVHFAADDIELLGEFIRRQGGVLHDVAQNIDGLHRAGVGDVDVINGAVKAGVGVHVTAGLLDFLVDAAAGAGGGALEQHVFEHMRKPGTEPFVLMDAAGGAPGLRGDDRRVVILAHDDGQAIIERGDGDAGRNGRYGSGVFTCLLYTSPSPRD